MGICSVSVLYIVLLQTCLTISSFSVSVSFFFLFSSALLSPSLCLSLVSLSVCLFLFLATAFSCSLYSLSFSLSPVSFPCSLSFSVRFSLPLLDFLYSIFSICLLHYLALSPLSFLRLLSFLLPIHEFFYSLSLPVLPSILLSFPSLSISAQSLCPFPYFFLLALSSPPSIRLSHFCVPLSPFSLLSISSLIFRRSLSYNCLCLFTLLFPLPLIPSLVISLSLSLPPLFSTHSFSMRILEINDMWCRWWVMPVR